VQLGPAEILVVLLVALLVFGPSRLPEIGRQVGNGVRELRKFEQHLKGDLGDVFGDDESLPPETPPAFVEPPA
jgi:TatA/E family protein of Tat protein translocase